jgi:hypothetical protein
VVVLLASALKLLDVATATVGIITGAAIVVAVAIPLVARGRRRKAPAAETAIPAPPTPIDTLELETAPTH